MPNSCFELSQTRHSSQGKFGKNDAFHEFALIGVIRVKAVPYFFRKDFSRCTSLLRSYFSLWPLAFSLGRACSQIRSTRQPTAWCPRHFTRPARRKVRFTTRSPVLFPYNL